MAVSVQPKKTNGTDPLPAPGSPTTDKQPVPGGMGTKVSTVQPADPNALAPKAPRWYARWWGNTMSFIFWIPSTIGRVCGSLIHRFKRKPLVKPTEDAPVVVKIQVTPDGYMFRGDSFTGIAVRPKDLPADQKFTVKVGDKVAVKGKELQGWRPFRSEVEVTKVGTVVQITTNEAPGAAVAEVKTA